MCFWAQGVQNPLSYRDLGRNTPKKMWVKGTRKGKAKEEQKAKK